MASPSPACPQVRNILRPTRVQPKLRVGGADDPAEAEADQIADKVMRMPEPSVHPRPAPVGIQRMCAECEEEVQRQPVEDEDEFVQTKETAGSKPSVTPGVAAEIASMRSGGQPLPTSERAFFEPRFGRDFGHVRVHTDAGAAASADAVAARAHTVGRDIAFANGQFSPQTTSGKKLLAHELTHVIQQEHTGMALQRQGPGSSTPHSCPTDIKVVRLYHIPFTAQDVSAGGLSGGGAVAEMEVSDPANKDWAGTRIHETVTAVAETCGSSSTGSDSFCGNVGSGGAAGSTWPVGEPSIILGFNGPSKRNTFYDWHYSHRISRDVLGHHGLTSCESECEQTFDSVGGGTLSPKFKIQRRLTPDNIGGKAVTQIAVTKPAKT